MNVAGHGRRVLLAAGAAALLASCSLVLDFSAAPGPSADGADVDASGGGGIDGPVVPPGADAAPDAIALDASPYCRPGSTDLYDDATGTCYLFLEFAQPYVTAQANCAARGGAQLASLTTRAEFDLVYARMLAAPYWIGLADLGVEGSYAWASGEPVAFTNWHTGEPNDANGGEDCIVMYGPYEGEFASYAGFWNDSLCPEELWAVCELALPTRD